MRGMWRYVEWEYYKEEPKWWTPENGEKSWFLTLEGCIADGVICEDKLEIIEQGNVFRTREEAIKEARLRAARYRVKKRIWELNGVEFLEFVPNINNYTFALVKDNRLAPTIWLINKICPNWQLLKSEELVEQLIEEMEQDLFLIRNE